MTRPHLGHGHRPQAPSRNLRPAAAYRRRGTAETSASFTAPETWYQPTERETTAFVVRDAGEGYIHPATVAEIRARIAQLPPVFQQGIEVVQLSPMTRKRRLFPLYGMQWGPNVYLYPIEESLVERYVRPPTPMQRQEAQMYGGKWSQHGQYWELSWTAASIREFYLNNVLIHEIGHLHDQRNTNAKKREQYAEWFAIEYGYRPWRSRQQA